MTTKTYIVALNKNVDYKQFWQEMETASYGVPYVPDRPVSIVDARDVFERICEYALTDEEATALRKDPRVAGVEVPIEEHPTFSWTTSSITNQVGNFTKPAAPVAYAGGEYSWGDNINWGLIRHSNIENLYGAGSTVPDGTTYSYDLDGTGVDVVIIDTGVQADHPEFQYVGNSTSRVQQIDWYAETGIAAFQGIDHYIDTEGHGTTVAGVVAGKTYGWAKGSNIYAIKATGPAPTTTITDAFAGLLTWHNNKFSSTGRPTSLNLSMAFTMQAAPTLTVATGETKFTACAATSSPKEGALHFLANVTGVNYRGTVTGNVAPGATPATSGNVSFDVLASAGLQVSDVRNADYTAPAWNGIPIEYTPYDVMLAELIDSGIIVSRAAGNHSYKIDLPGGADYDNYVSAPTNPDYPQVSQYLYYHRGASPKDPRMLTVGALENIPYSATVEQRAVFSAAGPGVDVYAAGVGIMTSASSNATTRLDRNGNPTTAPYFLDGGYLQVLGEGTSYAAPQIAGMAALYLQANPVASASDIKAWLVSNAAKSSSMYSTGFDTDYSNDRSLMGGAGLVAFFTDPDGYSFRVDDAVTIKYGLGVTRILNSSNSWQALKGMWTKTDSATWTPVKTAWIKTDPATWTRVYPTPMGVLTPTPNSLAFQPFQFHRDPQSDPTISPPKQLVITNTGDYDLVINSITLSNTSSYASYITNANTPITLVPQGQEQYGNSSVQVGVRVAGLAVGSYSADVVCVSNVGVFGTSTTLIPVSITVQPDFNGITANVSAVPNTDKTVSLDYYVLESPAQSNITITNSGNGANLTISNIVSANGYFSVSNVPATPITYNFSTYTGNSAQFTITAANLNAGTYSDTLIVNSNASNNPALSIPVTIKVTQPNGRSEDFNQAGVTTFTVPDHVHRIKVFAVGGGGSGGPSTNQAIIGGSGGGGGSGAYQWQTVSVTPGEVLSITVGGGNYPDRPTALRYYSFSGRNNWSAFMNSYAVWVNPDGISPVKIPVSSARSFSVGSPGTYTVRAQSDGALDVSIDGNLAISGATLQSISSANVVLSSGTHVINFVATNEGQTAGFAATITNSANTVVWSTRTNLVVPGSSDTTITGSFGTITAAGGLSGAAAYESYIAPQAYYGYDGGGYDNAGSTTGPGTGDC